ncbi:MAG: hypothetical protein ACM3TR_05580 [Caulobacteraceae bacterium]
MFKDLPGNIKVRLFTSFYTRIIAVSIMPFMALFFSDRLGKVFAGIFLLVTTLVSFIFKLWGGYIADRTRRKKVLVIANSSCALVMVLMTICLLPSNDFISTAIRDKNYLKYVIGLIFFFSAEFSVSNYIGIRLKETFNTISLFGLQIDGVRMMSAITIENTLVVISLTFLISSLMERVSKPKSYLLGIMFYGSGYAALNVVNTWYGVLIFGLLAVIGELTCVPIHMTEQAKLIPDDKFRGRVERREKCRCGSRCLVVNSNFSERSGVN